MIWMQLHMEIIHLLVSGGAVENEHDHGNGNAIEHEMGA